MALSVPLSRFTPRVGGGSAFYVRCHSRMKFKSPASIVAKLVAAGFLFGASARHSYDYYTLLRWVVCGVSAFAAYRAADARQTGWVWAFAIVALLFNPVIPVHLKRDTWAFIDFGVAIFLLVSVIFTDRQIPPP